MNDQPLRSLLRRAGLRFLLLGGVLLLFAASVWWDNAANRGISPPPATPIPFTDVPRGGVNTYNLHAEADPAKVARTFEMIAAAGMHWVRVQFPWEDIEICGKNDFVDHCRAASTGASTWTKYDYIVQQAQRNGLELIVRLDTPPNWARQRAINSPEIKAAAAAKRYPLTGPPDNYNDYGDFVATVAQRYRTSVRFFQIWNEPNLPGEWNYKKQDPAQLVELLRIARNRIKAANPNAVIIFPALSPTDGRGDGVNDLDYLQGVYDSGGRALFDIMSAQLYGLGQPPTEHRYVKPGSSLLQPIDTKADVGRVVLLHEIMVRNGDDRKAVWVSELGWNSAPKALGPAALTWGEPVSEEMKGAYLVQAMQRAQREWPWMGPMNIWMFRFGGLPPAPSDPTPYFQLVDFNFNPLPAYNAVKAYLTDSGAAQLPPARRNPLATAATLGSAALVITSSAWLMTALGALVTAGERRTRFRRRAFADRLATIFGTRSADLNPWMLGSLAVVLGLFYLGSPQLPLTILSALVFLGLALIRADLALLFVPMTVPLYLAPKGIWDARFGLRADGYFIPVHEFVLLCVAAGTALRIVRRREIGRWQRQINAQALLPIALFFMAGTLGVVVAASRGAALREWRWLIVEPLLFYGLVRYWLRDEQRRWPLISVWLGTGVVVALIGLLQITGLDLTGLLPRSNCFSSRVVLAEGGLQRISSVYCHPNNLALELDRVWPVLVALALVAVRSKRQVWLTASGAAICLLALGATFSKGGFMAAFVALIALGMLLRRRRNRMAGPLLGMAALGAVAVLALGLLFGVERLNPLGGSSGARVSLWAAALTMIRDRPLTGIGLDQFYYYRTAPQYGNRYINPPDRLTSEGTAAHPHNLVLDLLVRTGPLGLLVMAWLVLRLFVRARRLDGVDQRLAALGIGIVAALSAALTHGLVDNFYFVPDLAFSFWLMLGLVDTIPRPARIPAAKTERLERDLVAVPESQEHRQTPA